MKLRIKITGFLLLILSLQACQNKMGGSGQNLTNLPIDSATAAKFKFERYAYPFGQVKSGAVISYTFVFQNVGKSPLIIRDIRTSCGCTVVKFNHTPIPPGGKGQIKAVFDTAGKAGVQQKIITILANTIPNFTQIGFSGIVIFNK